MKRGDVVAVCYDGKWGRRIKGEVICQHNGHHITVRHGLFAEDGIVETRFRAMKRRGKRFFGGFVRGEGKLMTAMLGLPGDWYAVYKWKETP